MTTQEILALPMEDNDAGAETIGEYLCMLLIELWKLNEEFSSKRPFGNSGWPVYIYKTLIRAGVIEGEFDKWGGIDSMDWGKADELIVNCIQEVFSPPKNEVK